MADRKSWESISRWRGVWAAALVAGTMGSQGQAIQANDETGSIAPPKRLAIDHLAEDTGSVVHSSWIDEGVITISTVDPTRPPDSGSPSHIIQVSDENRIGFFSRFRRSSEPQSNRSGFFDRRRGQRAENSTTPPPEPSQPEEKPSMFDRMRQPFQSSSRTGGEPSGTTTPGTTSIGPSTTQIPVPPPVDPKTYTPPPPPPPMPADPVPTVEGEFPSENAVAAEIGEGSLMPSGEEPLGLVPLPVDAEIGALPPIPSPAPEMSSGPEVEGKTEAMTGPGLLPPAAADDPFAEIAITPEDTSKGTTASEGGAPVASGPSLGMPEASTDSVAPHDARYVALTRRLAERQSLVGMQGFCPVALRDGRDLVEARSEFLCVYEGRAYAVSSVDAKAKFDANPAYYAPAARGYDVVLSTRGEPNVEGRLSNAIWYRDELYLFQSPETASEFNDNPTLYLLDESK